MAAASSTFLDVHWLAAMGNPAVAVPWVHLARGLLLAGRTADGFTAAIHAFTVATALERAGLLAQLRDAWETAGVATPIDGEAAYTLGLAAASEGRLEAAVDALRWAVATEPGNGKRAHSLAVGLARLGRGSEALRVLAPHERGDAARLVGRALAEAGRDHDAIPFLRYASRRFRTVDDWGHFALVASRATDESMVVEAGRAAVALGTQDMHVLAALAKALYRTGEFVECKAIASRLIADAEDRELRITGLHAMARALGGQGRHVDAHPYARAAAELGPSGEVAAELIDTMDRLVAQQDPPVRANTEHSMVRQAFAELEAGRFDALTSAVASPSWGIARVALAAREFRGDDESGMLVASAALDAAVEVLQRSVGATTVDAVLARIRALEIRDNAFIQIDPPPPLGARSSQAEMERAFRERSRRPHRASAVESFTR